jgi:hypothetical protein
LPERTVKFKEYSYIKPVSGSGDLRALAAAALYRTEKSRKFISDYYTYKRRKINCGPRRGVIRMDIYFLDSNYFKKYGYILRGEKPKVRDLTDCGNNFECHEFIYDFDLTKDIDKSKLYYVIYAACDY